MPPRPHGRDRWRAGGRRESPAPAWAAVRRPSASGHVTLGLEARVDLAAVVLLPRVEGHLGVGLRLGLGLLEHFVRLGERYDHDALVVGHHHVPRMHHHASTADGMIDLPRTFLRGGNGRAAAGEERKGVGPALADVPDHPVHDESRHPTLLGDGADIPARHRHGIVPRFDHDHVSRLGPVDGRVEHEVVVARRPHSEGRPRDAPDVRPEGMDGVAHHAREIDDVRDRGGRQALEALDDVGGRTRDGEANGLGGFGHGVTPRV